MDDNWCEDPKRNRYANCDCHAGLEMRQAAADRFMNEHQEFLTQLGHQIEQLKQELQRLKKEFQTLYDDSSHRRPTIFPLGSPATEP